MRIWQHLLQRRSLAENLKQRAHKEAKVISDAKQ
jgi:hypothetical protein